MSETILELKGIHKSFGGVPVLNGIDLQAAQGEFITLLGSSGCGKDHHSADYRGAWRLPDQGRVLLEGKDMTDAQPNKRDVNTVFQNYALFPHMNVEQNIGYALKIRKRPKGEIQSRGENGCWSWCSWRALSSRNARGAFRRAEAAGGHCPVFDQPAQAAAAGRASGRVWTCSCGGRCSRN